MASLLSRWGLVQRDGAPSMDDGERKERINNPSFPPSGLVCSFLLPRRMTAKNRMRHLRVTERDSVQLNEEETGAATTMRIQKMRQLVDGRRKPTPPPSGADDAPPSPLSFFLFPPSKKNSPKKQWSKVASVPIERMHAIKAAFLDEVCR